MLRCHSVIETGRKEWRRYDAVPWRWYVPRPQLEEVPTADQPSVRPTRTILSSTRPRPAQAAGAPLDDTAAAAAAAVDVEAS